MNAFFRFATPALLPVLALTLALSLSACKPDADKKAAEAPATEMTAPIAMETPAAEAPAAETPAAEAPAAAETPAPVTEAPAVAETPAAPADATPAPAPATAETTAAPATTEAAAAPAAPDAPAASIASPEAVAAVPGFLSTLQTAVAADDRNAVAALVRYPLVTYNNGVETARYADAAALIAAYDTLFTPAVKDAIAKATPETLFTNIDGVMIGNGEVWIDNSSLPLMIKTINAQQ